VALATRASDAARAASAGPDVVAAKGMAREAREALSGGPSLARPDRDRVRAALEAMSVAIDEATARSDGVQREAVDAAVAAAADAIEAGDLGSAWGRFRSAREAVVGARISPEARRKLHEELDGLYARLQERREQARTEWRAHQERKREEFREKADRARDFVERQEEAAARCLHQAEEARSDEYADRMRRYAAEHQAKATEARGAVERMETILADIERQLAAGRPDRKRRADRGRGPDERPPAMVPAPPPEAVPAPPPKAVPAPPPEAVPDTPPEAVPDCAPEIADGPP
jgi:chromosome segregation ATPase